MNTGALSIEIQARRRVCCCCDAERWIPIHTGGQNLATDDVIDRAMWSFGWGKYMHEWYCRVCLAERPHVRAEIIDDRADAMAIRVVAANDWRKR